MSAADEKPLVLFLCTGNSARSIMAEAILRDRAGDRFEAASAGLAPTGLVNPLAIEALREIGVSTEGLHSKPSKMFLGRIAVRHAITVCEAADRSCPKVFPFATRRHSWPFEDPAAFEGTERGRLAKFREVRDAISARIDEWLESEPDGP
ncbi:MAG: arsenate reductase ArsC [Phycisphaeraceae bacterium]|nr:arsenate reductase ArsC [Phycisphaeraceae bacterium]